jgi:membrane protein
MVVSEFMLNQCITRASGLAFTLLFTLIPLLAFAAFLLGSTKELQALLGKFLPFAPPLLLQYIDKFVTNAQKLQGIGITVLIVMSVGLFGAVEESLNTIWKAASARSYFSKLRTFTMVMIYSPLLFFASFSFRRSVWFNFISDYFFPLDLLPVLFTFFAFTVLIWFIPNTRVRFRSALLGGVVAGTLFEAVRRGFASYVILSVQTQTIFGIFGIIPFFLASLFLISLVFLLGTEISYVYQNFFPLLRAKRRWNRRVDNHKSYVALRFLIDILTAFIKKADPPKLDYLLRKYELTEIQARGLTKSLSVAGYVNELGDNKGFVPKFDYTKERIKTALDAVENESRNILHIPDDYVKTCLTQFLRAEKCFVDPALEHATFEELVAHLEEKKKSTGTFIAVSSGGRTP